MRPHGGRRRNNQPLHLRQVAQSSASTMQDIVHMPGLVTPISTIMIDPSGERTIMTFRDPELWKVRLPEADKMLRIATPS